jgi:hypothetical protein
MYDKQSTREGINLLVESLTDGYKTFTAELFSEYVCHGDGSLRKCKKNRV